MDLISFLEEPELRPIMLFYFFVLGTVVGSFLNVCIYRIPLSRSIVLPSSKCPSCNAEIRWYHNIPLLSYIWLRGRCANCNVRISPVYPFVELLTGLLFSLLFYFFQLSAPFFIYAIFGSAIIVLIFIDYYHKLLPAVITFPGVAAGFLFSFKNPYLTPMESFIGIVFGACLPTIVLVLYKLVRKKEGLGHGDIVMLGMIGAFLGWRQVLLVLFFSSFLGSIIGIIIIALLRKDADYMLPFGTFIGAAALPAIFWGERVWQLYFFY